MLPSTVRGYPIRKLSLSADPKLVGNQSPYSLLFPLVPTGKALILALAVPLCRDPEALPPFGVLAFRVEGVDPAALSAAVDRALAPPDFVVNGHQVYLANGAFGPGGTYIYTTGELYFSVGTADQTLASELLAALP
jgi:hypothetical protein